jgi:signal peptidase I
VVAPRRFPWDDPSPSDREPPAPSRRERLAAKRRLRKRSRVEWVVVIVAAVVIAVLLRTFVVQTFYIPSDSMVPTLKRHDRVVVNKLSYHLHPVHRGDIVVFTTPDGVDKSFKDLVKRVIALPGETVEGRKNHVTINGKRLKESYLPAGTVTSDFGPVEVPANAVWVMGDNRTNSEDSRVFKSIRQSTIVGRVFIRIWPPARIKVFG